MLSPASLIDAEEHQVVPKPSFGGCGSEYPPARDESLDGVLRVVVVPGDAIVVQEHEKLVLVLKDSLLVFPCNLQFVLLRCQVAEEAGNVILVLVEVAVCEAELVNRVNDRLQHRHEPLGKLLQLFIKRAVEQVIIDVADEMD